MPAIERNISIEVGAVWDSELTLRGYDLTGATARMQIRDRDGELLVDMSTANGRLSIDPATGKIQRRLGATVTAAIQADDGFYDMEIIPGGNPDFAWKLYRGKVKFVREFTYG